MTKKSWIILGVLCLGFSFLFGCGVLFKAEYALQKKQYENCIPYYQKYLAKKPEATSVRAKLGFAYLNTGRLDAAITEYETVRQEDPGEADYIFKLGKAHLKKADFSNVIDIWQEYKDPARSIIEDEIRRQLVLLEVVESRRLAEKALTQEEHLNTLMPDANTIVVCDYQDATPDNSLGAFQKTLSAMIASDLNKISAFKVIKRVRLNALLDKMGFGQTGVTDKQTAIRVGRLLGAEHVVFGGLEPGSIKATTSLVSASKGEILETTWATVSKDKFYELQGVIVQNIVRTLNITLSSEETEAIAAPLTTNYDGFIHFGEALNEMDDGNWGKAGEFLAMALEQDSDFDLVRKAKKALPAPSTPHVRDLDSFQAAQIARMIEKSIEKAEAAQLEEEELYLGPGG